MKLREFRNGDADIICKWIRTEAELYRWSADRFNKFPLTGEDIIENYAPQTASRRFFPLTAVDDDGAAVGHFIIRYPREDDDSSVRFGFVIVVFTGNDSAHRCYEAVGFKEYSRRLCELPIGTWECIDMELYI